LSERFVLLAPFPMTVFAIGAIMIAIALFTVHSGAHPPATASAAVPALVAQRPRPVAPTASTTASGAAVAHAHAGTASSAYDEPAGVGD
jgi:hypothetical protein